ncbi:MAG TPA: hypothetical protein VJ936_02750 [Desulfobacteraceae bacterium]|nr:hypothetical protein [Desulfobacteraceae bacterium]
MDTIKKISPLPVALILSVFLLFTLSCSDNGENSSQPQVEDQKPTFSFFEVGKNSLLSNKLRNDLSKMLGDDAVETRTTIDLTINNKAFFEKHFPHFYRLNRQLNSQTGERVEHNTVNIAFRYAETKNLPFEYAGFLFSRYTNQPLLIRANFKKDQLSIIDTLKEKYGPPKILPWDRKAGRSLCWRKEKDLLVVSSIPGEFGNPDYEMAIYFAHALERLIATEQQKNEKKNAPKSPVKKVF